MIETAQDLILWQWPVKFIVTVAFYAFALKGMERLLRIAASSVVRVRHFMRDDTAVDYSTYRTQPRGTTARTQALWRMFTWWITQYGQTQREPLEVKILSMPSSDRSPMHGIWSREPDFGPAPDEEKVARDENP